MPNIIAELEKEQADALAATAAAEAAAATEPKAE